jgi:hypothetical protein
MQRRLIAVVGPHLHDVAEVDHQCAVDRFDRPPAPPPEHFESGLPILQQHRENARIGMVIDTEVPARRRSHAVGVSGLEQTG